VGRSALARLRSPAHLDAQDRRQRAEPVDRTAVAGRIGGLVGAGRAAADAPEVQEDVADGAQDDPGAERRVAADGVEVMAAATHAPARGEPAVDLRPTPSRPVPGDLVVDAAAQQPYLDALMSEDLPASGPLTDRRDLIERPRLRVATTVTP
jgi:hypothetical protein